MAIAPVLPAHLAAACPGLPVTCGDLAPARSGLAVACGGLGIARAGLGVARPVPEADRCDLEMLHGDFGMVGGSLERARHDLDLACGGLAKAGHDSKAVPARKSRYLITIEFHAFPQSSLLPIEGDSCPSVPAVNLSG